MSLSEVFRYAAANQNNKALVEALQKIAHGPLRTATAFREMAKDALMKDVSKKGKELSGVEHEENETANEYVSDNGQFGVGA
jgi:hypothetical protein